MESSREDHLNSLKHIQIKGKCKWAVGFQGLYPLYLTVQICSIRRALKIRADFRSLGWEDEERSSKHLFPDKGCSQKGLLSSPLKKLYATTWRDSLGSQLFLYSSCTPKSLISSYQFTGKVNYLSFLRPGLNDSLQNWDQILTECLAGRITRLNRDRWPRSEATKKKKSNVSVLYSILREKNISQETPSEIRSSCFIGNNCFISILK